jgi:membrane protein implicated in regulation of membrane protease activity
MNDWLTDNGWAIWLAIALVLVIVELLSLDLVLLMFGLGALVAAIATALGVPVVLAIVVFAVVSVAMLFIVRPPLVARLHAGPTLTTGHEALVGRSAVVLEPVDVRTGRVELSGEVWSARAADERQTFDTGIEVLVTRIDGATAVVTTKES